MNIKKIGFALVFLLVVGGAMYLNTERSGETTDTESTNAGLAEPSTNTQTSAPATSGVREPAKQPDANRESEPLDIQNYRLRHGYYASGSSSIDEMHPYELYDVDTLAQLAANEDGLAQLVLADKLVVTDPDSADSLYWQAAVNGQTAALVNIAASKMILVPGSADFGFPFTDDEGEVSGDYASVLGYYAAAEDLGDFIATELLRSHIDESDFKGSASSIIRICEAGFALAELIRAERQANWGETHLDEPEIVSFETPGPVCGK